jgi:hypothetical protein
MSLRMMQYVITMIESVSDCRGVYVIIPILEMMAYHTDVIM